METIQIGQCLSELPDGNASKIVGSNGVNGVLTTPAAISKSGGCEVLRANMEGGNWYRIAIGDKGSVTSSGVFSIGNQFNNDTSSSILFHAFATGYGGFSSITKIVPPTKSPITKARVLFKGSTTDVSYLEVFISLTGINNVYISASCLIGFELSFPTKVSADIPEGYSAKEVSF